MDGYKAIPVLIRQPPLPKIALLQIINQDEIHNNDERAFVLVSSYVEEQAYNPKEGPLDLDQGPMVMFQGGQYNMDVNTLIFIVGQQYQNKST